MRTLITGSSGHLGEALARTFADTPHEVVTADRLTSPFTTRVGDLADPSFATRCMDGVDAVMHTATLHKPHVATHPRQAFIDANITATLNLLTAATHAGVKAFVFISTTSVFGRALYPPADAPAVWVTEDLRPLPRNIYGVTKAAAEDLCELAHRLDGLPCIVLRTSRFFPEPDDNPTARAACADANIKAVEFLYRRVDLDDVVAACRCALDRAADIGFGRYIVSATTPFVPEDVADLRTDAPAVLARYLPDYAAEFARRNWRMLPSLDRVYDNHRARRELGWLPAYDFARVLASLRANQDPRSPLARAVGSKGYHAHR